MENNNMTINRDEYDALAYKAVRLHFAKLASKLPDDTSMKREDVVRWILNTRTEPEAEYGFL